MTNTKPIKIFRVFTTLYFAGLKVHDGPPSEREFRSNPPTIAIITSLMCEKHAVDVMMDKKISHLKHRSDGVLMEQNFVPLLKSAVIKTDVPLNVL